MQNADVLTQEQIQEFLKGSRSIEFTAQNRAEVYGFIQQVLVAQEYAMQGKKQRGAIRAYLCKVTGMSLPQMARLIRQYRQEGVVEAVAYRRRRFATKYTSRDVALLAEVDRAHGWLSGPATVHIFRRAYQRVISAAGLGGHAASVPFSNPGFPFRQRLRVRELRSGETAPEPADRLHQKPRQPDARQRVSRRQEWSDHPQTHGLRLHWSR